MVLLFPVAGAQHVLPAALGCRVGQHCWTCILPLLPACWFSMSLVHQKVVCTRNWWMEWGFMGSHGEETWCGRPMRQLKQPRQLFLFPMQTASGQFKPQQFAAFVNRGVFFVCECIYILAGNSFCSIFFFPSNPLPSVIDW